LNESSLSEEIAKLKELWYDRWNNCLETFILFGAEKQKETLKIVLEFWKE
jgi:hypothetical protein